MQLPRLHPPFSRIWMLLPRQHPTILIRRSRLVHWLQRLRRDPTWMQLPRLHPPVSRIWMLLPRSLRFPRSSQGRHLRLRFSCRILRELWLRSLPWTGPLPLGRRLLPPIWWFRSLVKQDDFSSLHVLLKMLKVAWSEQQRIRLVH